MTWEEPGSQLLEGSGKASGSRPLRPSAQPTQRAAGPVTWEAADSAAAGGRRKGIRQPPVMAVGPADPACRWTRDVGGARQPAAGGQRKGIRQSPVTAVGPADPLEGGGKTSGRLGEVTERLCYRGIPLRLSAQPTRLRMASHRVSAIQSREGKG